MKKEESRFSDKTIFEGMTSVRAVIKSSELGISDRKIEKLIIDKEKNSSGSKEISYLKMIAKKLSIETELADKETIDSITTGNTHGGIAALCSGRNIPALDSDADIDKDGFYVMIEGIEDPYNFGYAIRTIYAAGASGIILSPRNWMWAAGVVARSSAGASELIPLYISEAENAVSFFKAKKYTVAAAGIRDSVSAFDADLTLPLFLIVGGEKRGISRKILDLCDITVRLDYGRSFRGSLSAASASSVLAYEVFRQNRDKILSKKI